MLSSAVQNKTNSTAGAVQVKANLQEELSVRLHFRKLTCSYKRQVLKVISHAALALIVSETLTFQILDLEKVDQGYRVT